MLSAKVGGNSSSNGSDSKKSSKVDNREENSLDHIVKEDESIGDAEIKNEEEEELEEEEGET